MNFKNYIQNFPDFFENPDEANLAQDIFRDDPTQLTSYLNKFIEDSKKQIESYYSSIPMDNYTRSVNWTKRLMDDLLSTTLVGVVRYQLICFFDFHNKLKNLCQMIEGLNKELPELKSKGDIIINGFNRINNFANEISKSHQLEPYFALEEAKEKLRKYRVSEIWEVLEVINSLKFHKSISETEKDKLWQAIERLPNSIQDEIVDILKKIFVL